MNREEIYKVMVKHCQRSFIMCGMHDMDYITRQSNILAVKYTNRLFNNEVIDIGEIIYKKNTRGFWL